MRDAASDVRASVQRCTVPSGAVELPSPRPVVLTSCRPALARRHTPAILCRLVSLR